MKKVLTANIEYLYEQKEFFGLIKKTKEEIYITGWIWWGKSEEEIKQELIDKGLLEKNYYPWAASFFEGWEESIKIINANILIFEPDFSLDTLKKRLPAKDFLEYCKQELYPVETIVA